MSPKTKLLLNIFAITALSIAIAFVYKEGLAWTSPTINPPGGSGVFKVVGGNVGIGATIPSTGLKLDVEGKVGATEYCDQDGGNCRTPITQTWQDVMSSRSGGTWYKNTTANPISVAITFRDYPGVGDGGFSVSPNNGATSMEIAYIETSIEAWMSHDHIVPAGWSYKTDASWISKWHELR